MSDTELYGDSHRAVIPFVSPTRGSVVRATSGCACTASRLFNSRLICLFVCLFVCLFFLGGVGVVPYPYQKKMHHKLICLDILTSVTIFIIKMYEPLYTMGFLCLEPVEL